MVIIPVFLQVQKLSDDVTLDERQKTEFECENGLTDLRTSLFRGLVFHFPPTSDPAVTTSRELLKLRAKMLGGGVSEELGSGVTHVLTDQVTEDLRQVRRDRIIRGETLFHLLNISWLEECVTAQKVLGVGQYLM